MFLGRSQFAKAIRIIAFREEILLEAYFAVKFSTHGCKVAQFQHTFTPLASEASLVENEPISLEFLHCVDSLAA